MLVRLQGLAALRTHLGGLSAGANGSAGTSFGWAAAVLHTMAPLATAHAHQLLMEQRQTTAEGMQVPFSSCCVCAVSEWRLLHAWALQQYTAKRVDSF